MKRILLSLIAVLCLASFAEAQVPYRYRHYYTPSYSTYRAPYYGGYSSPIGYGAGGYGAFSNGFGYYQPWSTWTYPSYGGGAMTTTYGGTFTPWGYQPFAFSGYNPGYGFGGGY